jgi:hypothetical protein
VHFCHQCPFPVVKSGKYSTWFVFSHCLLPWNFFENCNSLSCNALLLIT